MIDIHCHILHGIDDGPSRLADSVAMARAAVSSGITAVVATPHLRSDFPAVKVDEIAGRCQDLCEVYAREGIKLKVIPGGEVGLSWALEADDVALKLASYGQNGTDILIETPSLVGSTFPTLLGQVMARGYRVTLAHPERSKDLRENPDLVDRLVEQGVRLQVNADALLVPARRSPIGKSALAFCKAGLVTAVASDGHRGSDWRPVTAMAEGRSAIANLMGDGAADQLLSEWPSAIVAGERLPRPYRANSGRVHKLSLRWRH